MVEGKAGLEALVASSATVIPEPIAVDGVAVLTDVIECSSRPQ
ncbi:hypothetical protein [Streptomyces sp. IB201691-2A2]|nr:hypothetical protein [Streptomyces sp. IB201691-2A2]